MSVVAAETPEVRDRLMAAVAEILRTDPDTAGRDEIVLPYTTELHWLRRLDGAGARWRADGRARRAVGSR